ncbi:hypothetical protein [Blautia obeum]|nr:hypothetical protein [Blautia obeum]
MKFITEKEELDKLKNFQVINKEKYEKLTDEEKGDITFFVTAD